MFSYFYLFERRTRKNCFALWLNVSVSWPSSSNVLIKLVTFFCAMDRYDSVVLQGVYWTSMGLSPLPGRRQTERIAAETADCEHDFSETWPVSLNCKRSIRVKTQLPYDSTLDRSWTISSISPCTVLAHFRNVLITDINSLSFFIWKFELWCKYISEHMVLKKKNKIKINACDNFFQPIIRYQHITWKML